MTDFNIEHELGLYFSSKSIIDEGYIDSLSEKLSELLTQYADETVDQESVMMALDELVTETAKHLLDDEDTEEE